MIQEMLAEAEAGRETLLISSVLKTAKTLKPCAAKKKSPRQSTDEARSRQQTLKGRQASLEALQQAAMGDDAEKQWLAAKGLGDKPRLADSVVSRQWLGSGSRNSIWAAIYRRSAVDDIASNIGLLDDFKKGELLLIGKASTAATSGNKGQLLSDLVTGDSARGTHGQCLCRRESGRRTKAAANIIGYRIRGYP